jgi:hypothetical protein
MQEFYTDDHRALFALALIRRMAASMATDVDTVLNGLDDQLPPLNKPKAKAKDFKPLPELAPEAPVAPPLVRRQRRNFRGGLTLTELIMQILRQQGQARGMRYADLYAAILNSGYNSRSQNMENMVYQAVMRLRKENKLRKDRRSNYITLTDQQ